MGRQRPPGFLSRKARRKALVPKSREIADQRKRDMRAFDVLAGRGMRRVRDIIDEGGE